MKFFKKMWHELSLLFHKDTSKIHDYSLGQRYRAYVEDILLDRDDSLRPLSNYHTEITLFAQLCQQDKALCDQLNAAVPASHISVRFIEHIGKLNAKLGYPVQIQGNGSVAAADWIQIWHVLHQHAATAALQEAAQKKDRSFRSLTQPVTHHLNSRMPDHLKDFIYYSNDFIGLTGLGFLHGVLGYGLILSLILAIFTTSQGIVLHLTASEGSGLGRYSTLAALTLIPFIHSWCYIRLNNRCAVISKRNRAKYLVSTVPDQWEDVPHTESIGAAYLRSRLSQGNVESLTQLTPREQAVFTLFDLNEVKHTVSRTADSVDSATAQGSIINQYFKPTPLCVQSLPEEVALTPEPREML